MSKATWIGALSLTLLCAGNATAEEAKTGLELGIRSGIAIPMGKGGANATKDLSDGIKMAVPLWADLGYRITPNVTLGVYGAYQFGFLGDFMKDSCSQSKADCSVHGLRLGAQFNHHLSPGQTVDPWIGVGIGYEWLTFDLSQNGQKVSITASGLEIFNFQVGVDLAPAGGIALGPFASFSLAQYSKSTCSGSDASTRCGGDIDSTMHQWITFGVRGVVLP